MLTLHHSKRLQHFTHFCPGKMLNLQAYSEKSQWVLSQVQSIDDDACFRLFLLLLAVKYQ